MHYMPEMGHAFEAAETVDERRFRVVARSRNGEREGSRVRFRAALDYVDKNIDALLLSEPRRPQDANRTAVGEMRFDRRNVVWVRNFVKLLLRPGERARKQGTVVRIRYMYGVHPAEQSPVEATEVERVVQARVRR